MVDFKRKRSQGLGIGKITSRINHSSSGLNDRLEKGSVLAK